ncbi:MAG: CAP domain-containing protein, partial [Clostridiales bacterium]|nr:CAP domain-containing protein [Clostridiales bacterium]
MKRNLKKWLSALLAVCLLCSVAAPTAFADDEDTTTTTTVQLTVTYDQTGARSMLSMINKFRTGDDAWYWNRDNETKTTCTDLAELTYDYNLEAVAMQRAAEIALSYTHTRPNGEGSETAPNEYYEALGITLYVRGENIAYGYNSYTTAEDVFVGWQEIDDDYSGQGHRRNMLSSAYTAVGIAHVKCDGCEFWVQVFGKPAELNTTETAALDGEDTVTIEVLDSDVTTASLTPSTASYSLTCGGSEALPTLVASLTMTNTKRNGSARTVTIVSPTWSSDKTSVATFFRNEVVAVTAGSANLTASALGSLVSVPVTVSHGTTEIMGAKNATCTENGYTGFTFCTGCGKTVTAGETIPATGHTAAEAVVENEVAATCTEPGSYDSVVYCSVC